MRVYSSKDRPFLTLRARLGKSCSADRHRMAPGHLDQNSRRRAAHKYEICATAPTTSCFMKTSNVSGNSKWKEKESF